MLIVSFIGFFSLEWIIRDHNHESQGRLKWIKHERVGYFAISVCEIHTVFIWLKVLNSLDSLTLSPSYSISRNIFSIWATSTTSLRIILSPPRKTRIPKVIPKENRYIYIICPHTLFIFNHTKIKIVPLIILWREQIDLH